jgi:hypothetical protein
MVGGKKVCRTVFCGDLGIHVSRGKLTKIRKAYNHGPQGKLAMSARSKHLELQSIDKKEQMATRAVAFWTYFFLHAKTWPTTLSSPGFQSISPPTKYTLNTSPPSWFLKHYPTECSAVISARPMHGFATS